MVGLVLQALPPDDFRRYATAFDRIAGIAAPRRALTAAESARGRSGAASASRVYCPQKL